MPRLPNFEFHTRVNHSPHVVILGAGASRAAFPDGDAKKRQLPLMTDLIDCLGLNEDIRAAGFVDVTDFEAIYDELATTKRNPSLRGEIESRVRDYFEQLELPDVPTLYDYLLLSLREKDCIASFNWDPFLAKAFIRNRDAASLPRILFLHGNVEIGIILRQNQRVQRRQMSQVRWSPSTHKTSLSRSTKGLQIRPVHCG